MSSDYIIALKSDDQQQSFDEDDYNEIRSFLLKRYYSDKTAESAATIGAILIQKLTSGALFSEATTSAHELNDALVALRRHGVPAGGILGDLYDEPRVCGALCVASLDAPDGAPPLDEHLGIEWLRNVLAKTVKANRAQSLPPEIASVASGFAPERIPGDGDTPALHPGTTNASNDKPMEGTPTPDDKPAKKRGRPRKEAAALVIPPHRTRATIDTLVIRVTLPSEDHSANVAKRLKDSLDCKDRRSIAVKPDKAVGRVKTVFVQDVCADRLRRLIETLGAGAIITQLDVAVNFRPADPADLDHLCVILRKTISPIMQTDASGWSAPRVSTGAGDKTKRVVDDIPLGDGTLYVNSRTRNDIEVKVYAKRFNERVEVPPDRQVARVEASIHGDELVRLLYPECDEEPGMVPLAKLLEFDFKKLAGLFKFYIPMASQESALACSTPSSNKAALKPLTAHAKHALERLTDEFR